MKQELLDAVQEVARRTGRDPDQLLAELLAKELRGSHGQQMTRSPDPPVEVLPPARPMPQRQQQRPQMQVPQRFAGVPAPRSEEDIESLMRYLEAESGDGGVFSDGGMSGGGVFGGAPVATAGFDPGAEQRGAQVALARMAPQLLQAMQRQPPPHYPQMAPPPPPQPARMMVQTTVAYYEGPPPQQQQPMPMMPMLPFWPWGR